LRKDEVRRRARALGLPARERPDSQDLCFLPAGGMERFLRERCPDALRPGPVLHVSGDRLGTHRGAAAFTIGQRRGLGIAHSEPLYVVGLDPARNAVIVGERPHALRDRVDVRGLNWVSIPPPDGPLTTEVQVRSTHRAAEARVTPAGDGRATVEFREPQEAPCPGQVAAFFSGDVLLGAGTISEAQRMGDRP
jgi:tRNA-specific 2-thiouridylase